MTKYFQKTKYSITQDWTLKTCKFPLKFMNTDIPMHLHYPKKGTKNGTIYAESDSNFGYKQTIKISIG